MDATSHKITNSSSEEVGWVQYDVEDGQNFHLEGSAVIGMSKASEAGLHNYHVIILRQKADNEYRRIGYGVIQWDYVVRQRSDIWIL